MMCSFFTHIFCRCRAKKEVNIKIFSLFFSDFSESQLFIVDTVTIEIPVKLVLMSKA